MKITVSIFLICFLLTGCKKKDRITSDISDPDVLSQNITYKTIATIPSPADSASGLLRDSLSVSKINSKNDPDFLFNISNVSSHLARNFNGFSFCYDDPGKPFPYFCFSVLAFPGVPRQFVLNKAYEYTSIRSNTNQQLFLGSPDGLNGMTYFVNNVYPADAGFPSSRTYTNVTFTNKIKILRWSNTDTTLFGSGRIFGYWINYYHLTDTTKYVQRWDFTIDFTNLRIDP